MTEIHRHLRFSYATVDDADRAHGPSAAGGVKYPSAQAAIAHASAKVALRDDELLALLR